jgi:type IV pilus assembly protein PilW
MSRRSTHRHAQARRNVPSLRWAQGFTLIELMIAMLLGLIVIAGITSVFLAGQRSYRVNQALGDVQDGSRIAYELMARDIRDAGLTGCGNSGRVANVLKNNGSGSATPDWWANWGNAVHGYTATGAATDPALTVGTSAATQVENTDSIQLIGAANSGLSVKDDNEPSAGFHINSATNDLAKGDVLIVCDPDHAAIFQVTNDPQVGTAEVNHDSSTGSANCSKGLGYPTDCTTNGNSYQFGPNSQIFKLAATDWYIGNYVDSSGVKGKSLYRVSVVTSGATPTATAQEMVRGVTDLVIRYHVAGAATYVDAATVTLAANWGAVDAVRVQWTVQSVNQRAGTDNKPISRPFTATTTLRNRVK